jgi:ketosteroid isomerase-like protein
MDTRTNSQVINELYDAYVTGNIAAFDIYTEDSVWVEVGRNKRTGVYRGKQAIREHAMQLAVLTDGTIATNVTEILPGNDHVAVLERATRNETAVSWIWIAVRCTPFAMARSPTSMYCRSTPRGGTSFGRRP